MSMYELRRETHAAVKALRAQMGPPRHLLRAPSPSVMARVYFIRVGEDGPIKIGIASDPRQRRSSMQSGNPEPLIILKTVRGNGHHEKQLHAKFAHLKIRGEWFSPAPELLNYIAGLKEGSSP
jgi:hypothetical protein